MTNPLHNSAPFDKVLEFARSREAPWIVTWERDFQDLDLEPLEVRARARVSRGPFILIDPQDDSGT